jgi:flagellar biosynthesis protein FliP
LGGLRDRISAVPRFRVIDLEVTSVLKSIGMIMLPPLVVPLPFKPILFVLVEG